VRRLSKPYSTSIDGSFQIVKERKKQTKRDLIRARSLERKSVSVYSFCCCLSRSYERRDGGADRDRTGDPLLAKQVLSQLSYSPVHGSPMIVGPGRLVTSGRRSRRSTVDDEEVVGLGRVELPTSPLSGVRSNQLSYRPVTHEPVRGGKRALPSAPCPVPLKQLVLGARSER
jgi:hypothetical protein